MKLLSSILLVFVLSKGCSKEQNFSDVKIEYTASTRGFQKTITIEQNSFLVTHKRNSKPVLVKLTDEQWQKIGNLYSKIDLNTFNDLEGATKERTYDAKAHANMSISVKDKNYTTKGFDHTIPPVEIKEFVDYINEIAVNSEPINSILGNYLVETFMSNDVSTKEYYINFDKNNFSGFMGCNMYSGNYEVQNTKITLSGLISTKMYCENAMENENLWFKIAEKIASFKTESNSILLYDNDNKLVLKATKQ